MMLSDQRRSSHRRCSVRKDVYQNFAKFTGKHLRQSLFFNKAAGISNFIKNEALAQVFSCEFYEISNNNFFTKHFRWLLLSGILLNNLMENYVLCLLISTFTKNSFFESKSRCCIYKKNTMSLPEDVILCSRTKTRILI